MSVIFGDNYPNSPGLRFALGVGLISLWMNRVSFLGIVYFFFTYVYKKLLRIYIDRAPLRYSN